MKVSFDELQQFPRNEVTLLGNLGGEVLLRTTATGKDVASVNLAVNKGAKGAPDTTTMWCAWCLSTKVFEFEIYSIGSLTAFDISHHLIS